MITLPEALQKFMQQQDLTGLKPYALLYRNKWVEEESGSGDTGHYELETTPIDITDMIVKPNTLSMTLDVNEVAQYNCNNVTLTLADTKNRFIEGTQNSLFPDGYQIYGSKVVLYYGLNNPINPYRTQVGYTLVGNPTIVDGVVSNLNDSNSIETSSSFAKNDWEMVLTIKTGTIGTVGNVRPSGNQSLFEMSGNTNTAVVIYGGKLNLSGVGNIGNFSLSSNTLYKFKFTYKASNSLLSAFVLNNNWQLIGTKTAANLFGKVVFGRRTTLPDRYFLGSFDLNKSYIEVNGEYWFNGAYFFYEPKVTPLFTGSIKELPTHKPEQYQVELKLVSPLEMLKDIEAKNFSDKVIGETLTYIETDSDGHPVYNTANNIVGGFDGVYANGEKLFESVDYEVEQLSELELPAVVTIINSDYYSATITADYYCWKTDLTVEQVVEGLVGLAGYDSTTEDIRTVVWKTGGVRNPPQISQVRATLGYEQTGLNEYTYSWQTPFATWDATSTGSRKNMLPTNFDYSFDIILNYGAGAQHAGTTTISLGDEADSTIVREHGEHLGVTGVLNGISVRLYLSSYMFLQTKTLYIHQITNGTPTLLLEQDIPMISGNNYQACNGLKITRRGNTVNVYLEGTQIATCTINTTLDFLNQTNHNSTGLKNHGLYNQTWDFYDNNLNLYAAGLKNPCIVTDICDKTAAGQAWGAINADFTNGNAGYFLNVYFSDDLTNWSAPQSYNLNTVMGITDRYLYYVLGIGSAPSDSFDISNPTTWYLASTLLLNLVNLSGKTVLEALQDFALISGYEFGVDRQGVFFFKPRLQSTTPIYVLDHSELTKVDTVKRNFSDFFTKLTLTFAQKPLEFYANTGYRPTPVDKYGIINKDIDKPEIVNYDNPELAQAIGPQLLEVYSTLSNIIQATGKLNLALELGDIVSLRRNMNLVEPNDAKECVKYINSSIYYRACKITGMNYNFAKRQITYTLRDVTSDNNLPPIDAYSFPYELPIPLGKLIED